MSLDRRIVSILYFNGIEDVESIQEFLGEKNGYFEVLINGEVKKLKIPGYDDIEETIFTSFEFQEMKKNELEKQLSDNEEKRAEIASVLRDNLQKEDGSPYLSEEWINENILKNKTKEVFEQKTFEEELLEAKKASESELISVEVYNVPTVSFEEELEKNEIENEKFLKDVEVKEEVNDVKEKIKKPRTSTKKLKSKIDDDIDDFINTI